MAGKSLEEIWKQMQEQKNTERQRQESQERYLFEQREKARQDYLKRMRMFEYAGSSAVAAAASSAAGAGGGTPARRRTPEPVIVSSQHSMIFWSHSNDTKIFSYFIYNYETDVLTDIKQRTFDAEPSYYPITDGGFLFYSLNQTTDPNYYEMIFISLNGEIIWEDRTDNADFIDVETFGKYVGAYYPKNSKYELVLFDVNDKIISFTYDHQVEGGGYSYDDAWNRGIVVRESVPSDEFIYIYKYYIVNVEEGTSTYFYEVNGTAANIYQYGFAEKILSNEGYRVFKVWSSTGELLSTFDMVEEFGGAAYLSLYEFAFIGENGSFILMGRDIEQTGDNICLFYSGVSDTFSYQRINNGVYPNYISRINRQKSLFAPENQLAGGTGYIIFYDEISQNGSWNTVQNSLILPFWSTDEEIREVFENIIFEFGDGEISRTEETINILIIDNESYSSLRFNIDGTYEFLDLGVASVDVSVHELLRMRDRTILIFADYSGETTYRCITINLNGEVYGTDLSITGGISFYNEGNVGIIRGDTDIWVSNDLNNREFTLLDGYYEIETYKRGYGVSDINGYRKGNFLFRTDYTSILIGEDFISDEFVVPMSGDFSKNEASVFYRGCIIVGEDIEQAIKTIFFYNNNGELIDQKTYSDELFIFTAASGNRALARVDGEFDEILTFDGEKVRVVETGLPYIYYDANDYYWWLQWPNP